MRYRRKNKISTDGILGALTEIDAIAQEHGLDLDAVDRARGMTFIDSPYPYGITPKFRNEFQ